MSREIFLGVLTAVLGFVPLVGAMVVWVPATLWVGFNIGWGWAAFVAIYSMAVTGTIDNLLRPFFMRGQTDIHPLLVFLAVFGGMYWMNIPGALVGPVIVAFFLALYTIYRRDFLGIPDPPKEESESTLARLRRWAARLMPEPSVVATPLTPAPANGTPDEVGDPVEPSEPESPPEGAATDA